MASSVEAQLSAMTLGDAPYVTHGPCHNLGEWKSQLETITTGLPTEFLLTKTLVFKPSKYIT